MSGVSLSLPWPPSVNTYWRHVDGKVLISRAGREYRRAVTEHAVTRSRHTLRGELAVRIVAHPPDRRRRDLDNVLKALLDALEHAGVYENDHQVGDLHIVRSYPREGGRVDVQVEVLQ